MCETYPPPQITAELIGELPASHGDSELSSMAHAPTRLMRLSLQGRTILSRGPTCNMIALRFL